VSDESGRLAVSYSPHHTGLTTALKKGKESVIVEATTLDEAWQISDLNHVEICKIDTEGCDLKVLKGASKALARTHYVIVEQNTSETRRLLSENGFWLSTFEPSGYLLASAGPPSKQHK
jgi:hypothetical protein